MMKYYSTKEVADTLGIKHKAVQHWISTGNLVAFPVRARYHEIDGEELKHFLLNPPTIQIKSKIALIDRDAIKKFI